MNNILDFIAKETNSKNDKSYKYCIEHVEVPKLNDDDKQDIIENNGTQGELLEKVEAALSQIFIDRDTGNLKRRFCCRT